MFYRRYPDCGAYLDPGERCTCHAEHMIQVMQKRKAAANIEKMIQEERNGQLRLVIQEV